MEACGIDSLLLLQHPCSSVSLLLLFCSYNCRKVRHRAQQKLIISAKLRERKDLTRVFQGRQLCSLFTIQVQITTFKGKTHFQIFFASHYTKQVSVRRCKEAPAYPLFAPFHWQQLANTLSTLLL